MQSQGAVKQGLPISPEQIANPENGAARAAATVVHIHLRDPKAHRGSRNPALYRPVVQRISKSAT